jgi:hypothetical protein
MYSSAESKNQVDASTANPPLQEFVFGTLTGFGLGLDKKSVERVENTIEYAQKPGSSDPNDCNIYCKKLQPRNPTSRSHTHYHCKHKPHALRMANFEAGTPQLEVAKKWFDAVGVLDTGKIDSLLSRNFKYQSFPKTIDVPELTKAKYIQWFGGTFTSMTKIEVRIQRRRTTFNSQTDIPLSPPFTK